MNGSQNGSDIGRKVGPCPRTRRRWVWVVFKPFFKPLKPHTPAVPGSRLGPKLPSQFYYWHETSLFRPPFFTHTQYRAMRSGFTRSRFQVRARAG